ncbi:ferredoxin reductase family protein [Halofilum ochraceum]|uniref:ferredoxin reductase family protein n=1 Tax=Halofilum ochraceum TaxID=1611323 RepID=UPI0011131FF8|nr:ferredoxin reductase family protein [Halofilum ochraceum]
MRRIDIDTTTTQPVRATRRRSGSLHGFALILVYVLVALLPLAVAVVAQAPGRPGLGDLASSIAMVGFAALLLEFAFSGRFRLLTDVVGMDALMRFHQFSGYVVLLMLLLHPYLYALFPGETGIPGDTDPGGSALAGVTGFIAWFGLIGLVFAAIFRDDLPIPYERWRLGHGVGAAIIAILGLVHTLGAGTAAASPVVAGFWIGAVGLALLSLLQVYALRPWLQLRRPWRVRAVHSVGDDIHELTIEPDRHDGLRFQAGQFVWLRIAPGPWGLREHPFSIASAPGDGPGLRFIIKANGDYTRQIGAVATGAAAWIDGPFGHFGEPDDDDAALLFIAGGVGLAPILGLLRDRLQRGDQRPMRLIYACRWRRDLILQEELDELTRGLDLDIVRVVDEEDRPAGAQAGPVGAELLRECLPDADRRRIGCFICAPPGMIDAMETLLVEAGVPPGRITSERFRYRFSAGSPIARRTRRVYMAVAGVLILAATLFALIS